MDNWHLHADSLVIWQNGAFSNHGNKIKKKKITVSCSAKRSQCGTETLTCVRDTRALVQARYELPEILRGEEEFQTNV